MTTFQILSAAAFAAIFVTLLYIWADIRELKNLTRENRREILRGSFGERAVRVTQTFPEPKEEAEPAAEEKRENLKPSEKQILQEVLTEFLG